MGERREEQLEKPRGSVPPIPGEMAPVIRMKVGVSRKEATDRDGSVGATCESRGRDPGRHARRGSAPDPRSLAGLLRGHGQRGARPAPRRAGASAIGLVGIGRAAPPARPNPAPARAARPGIPRPGTIHRAARRPGRRRTTSTTRGIAPTDGRQLLGWAAKQVPDAKGLVISFGKRKDYPPKIVDWDDEQVMAAYRYARAHNSR